jgi:hypothetical protein
MAPSRRGRVIPTAVAFTIVAAYVFVTMLFVLPPNPVASSLTGVTKAASPYFTQKWNVFAPNIATSNPQLRIQAQWRDAEGALVKSTWTNVTALEFGAVTGNALPSRVQKLSWNTLAAYLTRFRKLTDDQQAVVQDTFIQRSGQGFRGKPPEQLVEQLAAMADNRGAVLDLLRYDYMLKEYATYFATATYDHEIERIRWEIYRERPNSFEQRFDETAQYQSTTVQFGWRQADDRMRPDALATFEEVVARYGDGS